MSALVTDTGSRSPGDAARADRAVVVRDLGRSFGPRQVIAGIDLDIAPGEFVALLGRSGSGKTTILRTLAGLDDGATGEILVPERRAVVFQDPRLLPWSRVLDNVLLGRHGPEAARRGAEALGEVGLAGHEQDWPKTLSGGKPSGSPWRGRWSPSHSSCCSTSPSVPSTP